MADEFGPDHHAHQNELVFDAKRILSTDDIIIGCSGLAGIYHKLTEEDAVAGPILFALI